MQHTIGGVKLLEGAVVLGGPTGDILEMGESALAAVEPGEVPRLHLPLVLAVGAGNASVRPLPDEVASHTEPGSGPQDDGIGGSGIFEEQADHGCPFRCRATLGDPAGWERSIY